jgi:hypothetical protein
MTLYETVKLRLGISDSDEIPFYNGKSAKFTFDTYCLKITGTPECCQVLIVSNLYFADSDSFSTATDDLLEYMNNELISEPVMVLYDNGSFQDYIIRDGRWEKGFVIPGNVTESSNTITQWILTRY